MNTIYTVQELYLFSLSFSARVILASFTSSAVSVHSSTNLSTNFFLHLQFSWSKYSPISHALSQLLGFQINPLSHTPLPINYLHSHLHLFLSQRCLLLQTFSPNLHSHLQGSCYSINLVSLAFDIKLNTLTFKSFLTSGRQIFEYGLLILLQLPLHLLVVILEG